jgi:GT2 family glycosyltransferase
MAEPASIAVSEESDDAALHRILRGFFDPDWYRQRYHDVSVANADPLLHFIRHGIAERRNPNPFFDSAWYAEHNADVSAGGQHPLLHYLQFGAAELRNPHPGFNAVYYADQHPEAAANPLLYHIKIGLERGYLTEMPVEILDYLPSSHPALPMPHELAVDVIIPVYLGLEETRRCIESVLADASAPLARVIVVNDRSPDSALVAWLEELAGQHRIHLVQNPDNVGFVASVNNGMKAAGDHDVVLLNSDTEVPPGWLGRLAAQAYAGPRIATVSPFSNNATICGYPDNEGAPIVFGKTVAEMDEICRSVNTARFVDVPTTVGFCMYIRRAALQEVGLFDAERFTLGYGEENDFCLRAAALGWRHRLACDIFVYHTGSVSFGSRAKKLLTRAMGLILERYPDYGRIISRHVKLEAVAPFRFAITAALFRQSTLPVILMISHNVGGGVRHHIDTLVERYRDSARILLLEATDRGAALSVPALRNHPVLALPAKRVEDMIVMLRSIKVSRVHIHHLLGMDLDIRDLVHRLGLPFDVTVHDYHALCPQTNLLPRPDSQYCGEPDLAACNACIAVRPSHGARDILTWRAEWSWQFHEADRVLCPSADVLTRLQRFGLGARAVIAPHEPVEAKPWPLHVSPPRTGPLRIAVLGVLADHKGARTVASIAETADPGAIQIHLIGHTERNFPKPALKRLHVTGEYDDRDLMKLIRKVAPDVIWFPAVLPETFSYTLSAAIDSGIAIVATRIGAIPERVAGRPFTWLVEGGMSPSAWIVQFENVRAALANINSTEKVPPRVAVADFYATDYLLPIAVAATPASVRMRGTPSRPTIAIVPECYDTGSPTPCAYIRLLQPLDHPASGAGARLLMTDATSVLDYDVDLIITQRYALPDLAAAEALVAHARRTGAALVYDLDDDLLNIPTSHPDAADLRPRAKIVRRMLEKADAVWLSTESLKQSLAAIRPDALVIENQLDERIWTGSLAFQPFQDDPVRILCMGTSTHDRDFALIEPALARLKEEYGDRVVIDVLGMTNKPGIARGLNRIGPPSQSGRSYPGFVEWLTSVQPRWHIGLAPLLDTSFNHSKSPIKTMDYAAMGMLVLASDVPVYRGSLADGPAGQLVANDPRAWYAVLDWLVRDQPRRRSIAGRARDAFLAQASLASHPDRRRDAWTQLLQGRMSQPVSDLRHVETAPTMPHEQSHLLTRKRRHSGRGR